MGAPGRRHARGAGEMPKNQVPPIPTAHLRRIVAVFSVDACLVLGRAGSLRFEPAGIASRLRSS
jgi:hypothetical protein